jgi:hypothetical protein
MIIKDPDLKKDLDKIPDVDENGEPIYKIDEDIDLSEEDTEKDLEIPVFLQDNSDVSQGNTQDIKTSTEE